MKIKTTMTTKMKTTMMMQMTQQQTIGESLEPLPELMKLSLFSQINIILNIVFSIVIWELCCKRQIKINDVHVYTPTFEVHRVEGSKNL